MDFNLLLSKIGISANLTQDIALILVVVIASAAFGLFIGRFKLITILINIYVAYAILAVVPDQYLPEYTYALGFFMVAIIILTLFGKSFFEIHISGAGSGFLWRVFAMSFVEVMLLISIALSIMPKKTALTYVSDTAYGYLVSTNAQFIWMVLPLIFIFIIHKKLNR